jgi:hypothetical protein
MNPTDTTFVRPDDATFARLARRWFDIRRRLRVAKAQLDAARDGTSLYAARECRWSRLDSKLLRLEQKLVALVMRTVGPAPEFVQAENFMIAVATTGGVPRDRGGDSCLAILYLGRSSEPARESEAVLEPVS